MISQSDINNWHIKHPWDEFLQVEQDMWLERLVLSISKHSYLKDRMAISGGTALNKLWLPRPMRYSEDLDYVCLLGKGSNMLSYISEAGVSCGLRLRKGLRSWRLGTAYPKVFFEFPSEIDNDYHKLKVEISTPPAWMNLSSKHFEYLLQERVENWLPASSMVLTMTPKYMAAQKLQALYSRCKGRDLFDFYHLVSTLGVTSDDVVDLVDAAKANDQRFQKWDSTRAQYVMSKRINSEPRFMADLDYMTKGWSKTLEFQDALVVHEQFVSEVNKKVMQRQEDRENLGRIVSSGLVPGQSTGLSAKYDRSHARMLKQQGYTNAEIATMMRVSCSWVQRQTAGIKPGRKRKRYGK